MRGGRMSAYSDWKCGAMSDWEYQQYGVQENIRERMAEEDCCNVPTFYDDTCDDWEEKE